MDMRETAIQSITFVIGTLVVLVVGAALIAFSFKFFQARARRKLVNSRRTISVAGSAAAKSGGCAHMRSKSRAREHADGSITSICKKCGVAMRRVGPGEWEAIG